MFIHRINSTETENWEDAWRYSAGLSYAFKNNLTLRGGIAFDESPVVDEYRNPRLPGNDRLIVGVGVGYVLDDWSFDFGYSHHFIDQASINLIQTPENGILRGVVDPSIDYFSIEVSYKF